MQKENIVFPLNPKESYLSVLIAVALCPLKHSRIPVLSLQITSSSERLDKFSRNCSHVESRYVSARTFLSFLLVFRWKRGAQYFLPVWK